MADRLSRVSLGPVGVVAAVAVGVGVLVAQIRGGDDVFAAFWRGGVAAFAVLVFVAVATALWQEREVAEADIGPLGLKFGEFEQKSEKTFTTVNERITDQMTDVNERFRALEHRLARLEDRHWSDSRNDRQ